MKRYTYKRSVMDDSELAWMNDAPETYLFFDIETTGLSAARSDLYMIGCGYVEERMITVTLLFNNDGCSEPEMLAAFCDLADRFDTIVTYNGDTFDLPYIKEKYRQFRQLSCLDEKASLDVYRRLRSYKRIFQMESMRQSDLETRMGLRRDTFLSGKELIDVYRQYVRIGDERMLEQLLTHNKDDVDGLIFAARALNIPAFFDGAFEVLSIENREDELVFCLQTGRLPMTFAFAYEGARLEASDTEAVLTIPILQDELKYFYSDYKNYYFLPKENKAIHKDVARYVGPAFRVKAAPDTAYTPKRGRFVPAFQTETNYIYRKEYKNKDTYIELNETLLQDEIALKDYARGCIRSLKKNA